MSGNLPETVGVILLPDTVLFPNTGLPLRIFEPRYREMLADAIDGDCLFCVGHLQAGPHFLDEPTPAAIGTVGLIRTARELDDGTSNLVLQGIKRVFFEEWLASKSYPVARIRPLEDTTLTAAEEKAAMKRLRVAVSRYLCDFPPEYGVIYNQMINEVDDAGVCCYLIAQQFVSDAADRQMLLNLDEVRKRVDLLIKILDDQS